MIKALIIFGLVLLVVIGGMMTLLNNANKFRLPPDYDRTKSGFDDEDDWPNSAAKTEGRTDAPTAEDSDKSG